jgi:hypothetical protein
MRVIYEFGQYRIVEHVEPHPEVENLKGDMFDPRHNPDINPIELRQDEIEFEKFVNREGVFGYELQLWNPTIGRGWEHVDSCWGFVGQYSETDERFKHYIVEEMQRSIRVYPESVKGVLSYE